MTVIGALPSTPSLVAVTPADPTPAAVTRPFASTVATAGSLVLQVIARPEIPLPLAERSVAVSCSVAWRGRVSRSGAIVTVPTAKGGPTVTAAVPLADPLVAEMVTLACVTPVTIAYLGCWGPAGAAVAPAGSLLVQVSDGLFQLPGRLASPVRSGSSQAAQSLTDLW